MQMEPCVYVVDNDQGMLDSLTWIIESINLNVRTFSCPEKFLERYDPKQHSCALINVRLNGVSGADIQQNFQNQGIPLPMIFISSDADISLAVRTMKAGAVDFLTKPFNDQVLLETINRALSIDKEVREKHDEGIRIKEKYSLLSNREIQILQAVILGKKNKVISEELNISLKTVESHRASMMKKMDAKSVADLVKIALFTSFNKEKTTTQSLPQ